MLREELEVPRDAWQERAAALEGVPALLHWTAEIWCRLMLGGEADADVEAALWRQPDASPASDPLPARSV
jgi:hypothetical protein